AMLKAAYRFFANDDIAPDDMLQSHIEATYSRLNAVPLVLAVQDTTEANWTNLRVTEGLGPLGNSACHGLLVHTTLAITPERVPLGLLAQQVWARDPNDIGKRARRKQLPISQKESQKWLHSLDAVYTARDCCPTTHLISVGDREAEVLAAITLWALQVCEVAPPAEAEPIEWLLLTTVAVETVDDAIERVQWYSCRWGIEVWHRILKSGCHLEARQFQKAARLRRALALYSVLAWRIFYATMLARAVPDAPCSVLLEPDEWQALYCAVHRVPIPPAEPPPLGQAVTWIAQLGGFVGRRRSDRPGPEVMWRGLQHLGDLTTMYCIMRR